jgi:hypothetical protein
LRLDVEAEAMEADAAADVDTDRADLGSRRDEDAGVFERMDGNGKGGGKVGKKSLEVVDVAAGGKLFRRSVQ